MDNIYFEYQTKDNKTVEIDQNGFNKIIEDWVNIIDGHLPNQHLLVEIYNEYCETKGLDYRIGIVSDINSDDWSDWKILNLVQQLKEINPDDEFYNTATYLSFRDPLNDNNSPIQIGELLHYLVDYQALNALEEFGIDLDDPKYHVEKPSHSLKR